MAECDLRECPKCEGMAIWTECDRCCGEGEIDLYDEDPINEIPGDWQRCWVCGGAGGFLYCETCGYTSDPDAAAKNVEDDGKVER